MNCVELINISKSFGGISALSKVNLDVRKGEVHALVGENGAGKSTLMKILSGACSKDEGKILIENEEVLIKNTQDSKKLGIGIIYQEFSLVPDLNVAENIFLHHLGANRLWMDRKKIQKEAIRLINSLGFDINPSTKVRKLSVAHQQIVEIAKALSEKVNVLILDEPSAVLGPFEIQKLFDTIKRLKNENVAIIYISHHLDEIFQIADRVTVLKDGISSESMIISEIDKDAIIRQMLGRSLDTMYPDRQSAINKEILRIENIRINDKVKDVSFSVRSGEILGLAGLVGSGRTETARAIFSADKKDSGQIFLHGKRLNSNSPRKAIKAGIGMVPEDRKNQGIILNLSISQNISLTNLDKMTNKLGFLNSLEENKLAEGLIRKLSIKTPGSQIETEKLSGGNQQKVVLAKWISRNCEVLIIDEPTRGVDIGAKVEIYNLINELANKGIAIILISSETAELMGICDRIIVMRNGAIQGELDKEGFSEEQILRLSIGA